MTYFANQAVNRLQLHTAIATLAQGAGGVFVFVYMLRQGVSPPLVFCAVAAINACRFVLRPMVLPLGRRLGLRRLLVLGSLGESLVYPMLGFLHGLGAYLWLVIAVSSAGSVLYWTSYHAYFAALGDTATRGAQVGLGTAVTAVINVAAPELGGLALTVFGPGIAFDAVAVIQALAAAPLIGAPNVHVPQQPREGRREYLRGAILQSTDGWLDAGFVYVWQVALFITLDEHYEAYGGAMALAGGLGAVASLFIGRWIDLGHGRRSTILAYGVTAAVIVVQAASVGRPALAILANALVAFAGVLFVPAMMARVYNLAKASPVRSASTSPPRAAGTPAARSAASPALASPHSAPPWPSRCLPRWQAWSRAAPCSRSATVHARAPRPDGRWLATLRRDDS